MQCYIANYVLSVAGEMSEFDHFGAELTERLDELREVGDVLQSVQTD